MSLLSPEALIVIPAPSNSFLLKLPWPLPVANSIFLSKTLRVVVSSTKLFPVLYIFPSIKRFPVTSRSPSKLKSPLWFVIPVLFVLPVSSIFPLTTKFPIILESPILLVSPDISKSPVISTFPDISTLPVASKFEIWLSPVITKPFCPVIAPSAKTYPEDTMPFLT